MKWPLLVILALLGFVLTKTGEAVSSWQGIPVLAWPASGVSLALALLGGRKAAGLIFSLSFIAWATPSWSGGEWAPQALTLAAVIGFTDCAQALAAGWIMKRWRGNIELAASPKEVFRFVAAAMGPGAVPSASIGVMVLPQFGYLILDRGGAFLTSWLGNVVSILVITPAIMAWSHPWTATRTRRLNLLQVLLLFSVLCGLVFGGWITAPGRGLPFAFLLIPAALWLTRKFGHRGSPSAVFIFACFAVGGTVNDFGPFAGNDPEVFGWLLQGFLAIAAFTAMILAADNLASRLAADNLARSEKRYRELFENSPQAMWVYDSKTLRFMTVNQAAVRIYGYTRQEFLNLTVNDVCVSRESGNGAGSLTLQEHQHRRKDGTLLDVEVSCFDFDFDEHPATLMFSSDITERKRAENRARIFSELGRRLSAVRTARDAGRSIIEAADRLFGWDACLFELWQPDRKSLTTVISMDRIQGKQCELPGRTSAPGPLIRQAMESGARLILKEAPQFPAGAVPGENQSHPSASIMLAPVKTGTDPIAFLSIHSRLPNAYKDSDLQSLEALADHCAAALERIRAEQELERRVAERTAQLEAINRELEAFSYSVSHDLRAPLRSIRGFSEVLLERYSEQLDERGREFLRRSCDSSQHMDRLIEDLLELSRVTRAELQHQTINLSEIAGQIITELRKTDPDRKVTVTLASGLTTHGDERLLRIVLENLLRNAWKFTGRTAEPSIEFGVTPGPDPEFYVRDNGAGFDMEYATKLFGLFQRLHTSSEFPGTGVGLATVQRIVNRHGGKVRAESAPGQGAVFYFSVPAPG